MRKAIGSCFVVAGVVLASAAALGADPPDLEVNPVTGVIEVVDAAWSGSNFNVRFSQVTAEGAPKGSTMLTSNSAPDVDPRIATAANGDVVVVWWRDAKIDVVLYRKRILSTGVWAAERAVGRTNESGSHPRVVFVGGDAWAAYQILNANKTRSVGTQIIDDDPEPFRSIVATTAFTGDLDMQLESEMNHLWVTWIDSTTNVGYSAYDPATGMWSLPSYESYVMDSVSAARERIRDRLLIALN